MSGFDDFTSVTGQGSVIQSSILDQMNNKLLSKLDPEDYNIQLRHKSAAESSRLDEMKLNIANHIHVDEDEDTKTLVNLTKNNDTLGPDVLPDVSDSKEGQDAELEDDYSLLSPIVIKRHMDEKRKLGRYQLTSVERNKAALTQKMLAQGNKGKVTVGRAIKKLVKTGFNLAADGLGAAIGATIGAASSELLGPAGGVAVAGAVTSGINSARRAVIELLGNVLLEWLQGSSLYQSAAALIAQAQDAFLWGPAQERAATDLLSAVGNLWAP